MASLVEVLCSVVTLSNVTVAVHSLPWRKLLKNGRYRSFFALIESFNINVFVELIEHNYYNMHNQ